MLLAVVLVVLVPVSGLGVGSEQSSLGASARLQAATPTNDTTRHEHPDRIDRDGDLGDVRRWLAGRMGVRLEDCLVDVGLGETNVCELDGDYPDWLGKYVDVADETASGADDEHAETFERAAADAETFAESVSGYDETLREYRAARDAGDEARARRLARELQRQRDELRTTGEDLDGALGEIEGDSGVDLTDARRSVNATVRNVTELTTEIESDLFVATRLEADLSPRSISFLEPGTLAGRLVTENGSPVAGRTVRLEVGERGFVTETDARGAFAVEYRPTLIPVTTERFTVRYRPPNASVYLGSNDTVAVSISQVEPSVSVAVAPERARFGDAVRVTGSVAAAGVPAAGVPVALSIDGRRLGTVRTDADGTFAAAFSVDAADGPGEVAVVARLPLEDRALAPSAGQAPLTVRGSATALTMAAEPEGPGQLTVEGTLRTDDGDAVGDRPVTVRVNGTAVETVRTGPDGAFDASVSVPGSLRDDGPTTVAVEAVFDGSGTNLEGSRAGVTVVLPAGDGARPGDGTLFDRAASLVADLGPAELLAVVGLLGAALLVLLRRSWPTVRPSGSGGGEPGDGAAEPTPDAAPPADDDAARGPFALARERLGTDADGAVMLAYGAVRAALAERVAPAGREADTHWEFLMACQQDGLDEAALDSLTELTEAYERAAYAPMSVDRTDAESLLEAAEPLVGAVD